jgi:broad specificity phosphatase PhoE
MSDFRERSWGKYNRKPFTPFLKRNHGFNWMDEGGKSGLESLTEIAARIQRGLDNVYARYGTKTVLLIAHSGSIKIAMHLYRYGNFYKITDTLLHTKTEYGQIYDMQEA